MYHADLALWFWLTEGLPFHLRGSCFREKASPPRPLSCWWSFRCLRSSPATPRRLSPYWGTCGSGSWHQKHPSWEATYSSRFDRHECLFDCLELLHLDFNFVSEHSVDEDMSQIDHSPVFLILSFVLDGPRSNFPKLCLSLLVGIYQRHLLLDHCLDIFDVGLSLEMFLKDFRL